MSDGPAPKNNDSEWVMPETVFRTSEGRTPKSPVKPIDADEIDTQSPDPDEIDPDIVDTAIPNLDDSAEKQPDDTPDTQDEPPANTVRAAPVKPPKAKTGCAKSFLFIVGVIGFLAAAVIIAVIYFLFYSPTANAGPF